MAYVGAGGAMLPVLIFAAARAGVAFTPINYRLSAEGIQALIERLPEPLVIVDSRYRDMVGERRAAVMDSDEFLTAARSAEALNPAEFPDPESVAIVLFTSGTTSQPKAVELSHNNLTSYVTGTVEFESAGADDAALICVPPYHIAGVGAALSNLYAGRKMVYLPNFDADEWVRLVNAEQVTTATVVPTMLDRIVTVLEAGEPRAAVAAQPGLRRLEGGPAAGPARAGTAAGRGLRQRLRPDRDQLDDRGADPRRPPGGARGNPSADATAAKRLGSVGRPVPGIELQIRDEDGRVLGPGETGELFVRGEQVSGRYTGIGSVLDENGWFPTKDIALLDEEGYLFIGGRSDDTIIRGGENIAPAELEEVLIEHSHVRDVAVVGVEDPQWGQAIVAVVVPAVGIDPDPEELREHVRKSLRGSRTPDRVVFRDELPTTATGKVLRREIIENCAPTGQ